MRVDSGVLRPPRRAALAVRLGYLLTELTALMDSRTFSAVAVESAFVHKNPRTALVLGHARGVVLGLAAARELPVCEYPPAVVKRHVVGSGRATKGQIRKMVVAQLRTSEELAEDEADALAVALAHVRLGGAGMTGQAQPGGGAPMTRARQQYLDAMRRGRGRRR